MGTGRKDTVQKSVFYPMQKKKPKKRPAPKKRSPTARPLTGPRATAIRIVRIALIAGAVFASLPWVIAIIFRFIHPPFSAYMAECYFEHLFSEGPPYQIRHVWVPINKISPNLPLAVMTSEDQKFPTHDGFDFEAIDVAMEKNRAGKKLRGASTISQQVAKNVFLWPSRNFIRKGAEVYFTIVIETVWTKKKIMHMSSILVMNCQWTKRGVGRRRRI